jgi:hypothetical protein
MKLSPEAKGYVEALLHKATYEIALWLEDDHRRVSSMWTMTNPRFTEFAEHYAEGVRRGFTAIIGAYVEGYKMDGLFIDDDDEHEIMEEIKTMINTRLHHVTHSVTIRDFLHPVTGERFPNIDSQLRGEFDRLLSEAAIELRLTKSKLLIGKRSRNAQNTAAAVSQVSINGPNYGAIQLGTQNSTQTIATETQQMRNVKPLIRWSLLKPEVGIQRVPNIGDVEVTETDIERARQIGGNPQVELCEATTFGCAVRKYVLGLFTPGD